MPTNINGTTGVDKIQDGSVHDVDIDSVSSSKLTGDLPAISGSNLTDLPAEQLTGDLPAISGSNLTDLPAGELTGALPAISGANLTDLPGGGAWSVLSRTNLSSTASVIVDFSSYTSYDAFKIIVSGVQPSASNTYLQMLFGQNGASFDTSRATSTFRMSSTGAYTGTSSNAQYLTYLVVGGATGDVTGEIILSGDFSNTTALAQGTSSMAFQPTANVTQYKFCTHRTEVATENSIQLKMSGGTLVAGKITVLGLNQS